MAAQGHVLASLRAQTDFTYFKIIGRGWVYLSTILDDFSRYIISWKLCTTMKTSNVTDTLNMALEASGCDQATMMHKPRLRTTALATPPARSPITSKITT